MKARSRAKKKAKAPKAKKGNFFFRRVRTCGTNGTSHQCAVCAWITFVSGIETNVEPVHVQINVRNAMHESRLAPCKDHLTGRLKKSTKILHGLAVRVACRCLVFQSPLLLFATVTLVVSAVFKCDTISFQTQNGNLKAQLLHVFFWSLALH